MSLPRKVGHWMLFFSISDSIFGPCCRRAAEGSSQEVSQNGAPGRAGIRRRADQSDAGRGEEHVERLLAGPEKMGRLGVGLILLHQAAFLSRPA